MKNLSRHILIVVTVLMAGTLSYAQQSVSNLFSSNEKRGDEMFEDLYYDQAITYYKLALKRNTANRDLKLKIANSYRLLSEYKSSLEWYEQAYQGEGQPSDSIHNLYFADGLVTAARYDEAHDYYTRFWSQAPTDSRSTRKIEALERLDILFQDSSIIEVEPAPFNSSYNDLSAIPFDDGILFLSAQPAASLTDQDFLREENLLDFFHVRYDSGLGWSESKRLKNGLNSNYFEGPAAVYSGEKEIIISRSNIVLGKPITNADGKTNVQLYDATKIGDQWIVGKQLSFCNAEFSYTSPSLNATGDTLYFSSDMTGGFGGNDLYMSVKVNNEWDTPQNMGYTLNTEGNELYPFFIDDRLFFSSNGHGGLGGYDVHKAYLKNGIVKNIANLGVPVNSASDDFAYNIQSSTLNGSFTSNRDGGKGGDDIYTFTTSARVLAGIVKQEQDNTSIEGAEVILRRNGVEVGSMLTDSLGQFRFQLPLGEEFDLEASKADHRAALPVHIPNSVDRIDLDSLVLSLHKDDLFARGRILDNETQKLMGDVRVVLYNATDNLFDTLYTNAAGVYSFVLLPDKTFNIWASKSGYIFGEANINTLEIDSGVIINDIVLELEYEKKSVVHFAFDKYNLTSESKAILRRTAMAMQRTSHQLIISAYADARGTVEYNQKLSDKRALEVLNYFLSQGVDKSRITARGFGEALILNRCVDGVNCEEVEHSQNRRAEIKIEGSNVQ